MALLPEHVFPGQRQRNTPALPFAKPSPRCRAFRLREVSYNQTKIVWGIMKVKGAPLELGNMDTNGHFCVFKNICIFFKMLGQGV